METSVSARSHQMTSLPTLSRVWVVVALMVCLIGLLLYLTLSGTKEPPSPKYLWKIVGSPGKQLGEFDRPRGLAILNNGSWFVVDRSARIQKFTNTDQPEILWEMREKSWGNPKDITALPNGNILICDTHYGRVLVTAPDGTILQTWGGTGKEPGKFIHPLACAVDPVKKVAYIADYGGYVDRIQKFTLDGKFIKGWGTFGDKPGEMRRPSGLTLAPDGTLFVADSVNHRVQQFDSEGNLLNIFGEFGLTEGKLQYPYDIACDSSGNLYLSEFGNHRVSVFSTKGEFKFILGTRGVRSLGEFNQPWSLEVDKQNSRLFVSDTANGRVQILSLADIIQ